MSRTRHVAVRVAAGIAMVTAVAVGAGPAGLAASAVAATVTPSTPPPGTSTLADGVSGIQPQVAVLGSDGSRVLWATESVSPDDSGRPTLYIDAYYRVPVAGGTNEQLLQHSDDGAAGGTSAGSTYVFPGTVFDPQWLDFATGASGDAGLWGQAVAYPGGGVELDASTSATSPATFYLHTEAAPDDPGQLLGSAPDIHDAQSATVIADTHGILAQSGAVLDYLANGSTVSTKLDTAGIPGAGFRCTSVTAGAVGCTTGSRVYRIPTNGSAPTSFAATAVGRVVLTPTTTAWISTADGRLHTRIGATTTQTSFAVTSAAAAGDALVFARQGARAGGVYRITSAGSVPTLLARAPVARLAAQSVAVTAGSASWIDDSTGQHPVRSRSVAAGGGALRLGNTVTINPGSLVPFPDGFSEITVTDLAVSGPRSLFVARSVTRGQTTTGTVLLRDGSGAHALGAGADGHVALSGSRALWSTASRHVLLRNLATGSTRDLTRALGLREATSSYGYDLPGLTGVLYSRYLGFVRGGWAWRLDLATGQAESLGRTAAPAGIGDVLVAGDFAAWDSKADTSSPEVHIRNARTMAPVRTIAGARLWSVSQAGFITADIDGTAVFHAWASGATRGVPTDGVRVEGGLMAWIGNDHLPKVAPFPLSTARPQALGAPITTAAVRRGGSWGFEQPTSQALSSCTVVISNPAGAVVARLRCRAGDAAVGSAVVRWHARIGGRNAPAGRYHWQVVGRGSRGSLLPQTGDPRGAVTGTLVVTR